MNNKLVESGACEDPSTYHRYRFSLQTAYTGQVPYGYFICKKLNNLIMDNSKCQMIKSFTMHPLQSSIIEMGNQKKYTKSY